jgi:hypothetical protein
VLHHLDFESTRKRSAAWALAAISECFWIGSLAKRLSIPGDPVAWIGKAASYSRPVLGHDGQSNALISNPFLQFVIER